MCGIVGILNRDSHHRVDQLALDRMTDIMSYRGPDERGTYVDANLGFGHRRLSIIDLASGQQPMVDSVRGRTIVFNGEIYNYRSLRDTALSKGGITLHTSSDTEVLLQLADPGRLDWIEQLNGMFAFAVWDKHSRTLFLARDRLGVKPLYYADTGSSFVFASEIKSLLLFPGVRRQINEEKIGEYLAFRSVAGDETLFKGIKQLPAGHVMVLSPREYQPRIERFWREGIDNSAGNYADANKPLSDQFMDIFKDAVSSRLVSDVPVGTFNSGGVDSSLVTAVVRSFKADELHTFSVGFEEGTHDESRFAAIVSERYKTNHHALIVNQEDYSRQLEDTIYHLEEPINHPHTVQLLLLSKLARQYVTVVLTGEGSDEVFGGYPRYNIVKVGQILRLAPDFAIGWLTKALGRSGDQRMAKLSRSLGLASTDQAVVNSMFATASDIGRVYAGEVDLRSRRQKFSERFIDPGDDLGRVLYYDQRTYLPSLLARLDKVSMAASIEARVPFLDYRLVEWSYKLSSRFKIRRFVNKWIVKKAAEQWLPDEIVYRKKFGFDVPLGQWLRNGKTLGRYLDVLTDSTYRQRGYFRPQAVEALIKEHLTNAADHTEVLWGLLGFELWCRRFLDAQPTDVAPVGPIFV